MMGLSLAVAFLQAVQARLAPGHDGLRSRLLVMALCYAQPLVRSWWRYRTRLLAYRPPMGALGVLEHHGGSMPLSGRHTAAYWSEECPGRVQLLGCVLLYLNEHRWGRVIDSGWSDWDLEIYCHPWTIVRVCTAEEDHGGGRQLIRVNYRLRASNYLIAAAGFALLGGGIAGLFWPWPVAAAGSILLAGGLFVWGRGVSRASCVLDLFDRWAEDLGMIRCAPSPCARAGLLRRLSCLFRRAGDDSSRLDPEQRADAPPSPATVSE
jgi:hypothetical protein